MADTKISALTAATTPLAGTEVLPIVQSGATVKVANNDLRPKQIQSNATSGVLQVAGPAASSTRVMTTPDANFTVARTDAGQTFTGNQSITGTLGVSDVTTIGGAVSGAPFLGSAIYGSVYNSGLSGTSTDNAEFVVSSASRFAAMILVSPNNRGTNLYFGDTDSYTVGAIRYDHSTNAMAFDVNGALGMTLATGGNLSVVGALSKGSGSFKISHPLPQLEKTHDLVHSFVEAPQADLYYRGEVKLVNGMAQVNLDNASTMTEGTFVLLCRNVQCFTTNETGWDAVRGSVDGNVLSIESQNISSSDTISWLVVGERQDKHMMDTNWTDENGKVIVEPLKSVNNNAEIVKR